AKALQIALKPGDARILHIISDASQRMSQGELLQLQTDTASQLSADVYFRVISEKTAALFGASCKLGGLTAGADDSTLQTLWDLGQKIGMAFQIKDDILDYVGAKDELGKPAGQDLREGKATLPLLKALEKASDDEKNWVVEFLQKESVDEGELKDVIAFVVEKGGPAAADGVAKEFCNEAQMLLRRFPESPHTRAIEALISFVVDREN
ncbi:MAG TPA: polyprenyl synthetase family protein, partial [Bacteroidetes bacterium]|nr:polyprenyl synthetase family protein [Bacteroidota bacterium]